MSDLQLGILIGAAIVVAFVAIICAVDRKKEDDQ